MMTLRTNLSFSSVKVFHLHFDSIGYLTGLKNTGPSKGRQIEVDFPEDHDWSALYDEIERVPPETLKVSVGHLF